MVNVVFTDYEYGHGFNGSLTAGKYPSPTVSAHCSGKSSTEMEEEDVFYQKLNKLNESSGLSVLFNFRDTSMDLHQFYKTVTERGGYHQVTIEGEWEDIASNMNRKNRVPLTPIQLQKLYATILYPFEQMYHYRCPVKHNKTPKLHDIPLESLNLDRSTGKWKHDDEFYATQYNCTSKNTKHHHGIHKLYPEEKQARNEPCVPLGSRNCYQMFFKMEGDRLKRIYGDDSFVDLGDMVEAWNQLSSDDKRPYIEASKKDKERYRREMAAYEENKRKRQRTMKTGIKFSSPTINDFTKPSQETTRVSHVLSCQDAANQKVVDLDGDYHVALQPSDSEETALESNESMVQMAVGLMNNARSNDPIFQIDWDA